MKTWTERQFRWFRIACASAACSASGIFLLLSLLRQSITLTDFRYIWVAGDVWAAGLNPYSQDYAIAGARSFPNGYPVNIWVYPFHWYLPARAVAERQAQKWVAISFYLLAPYVAAEAIETLVEGAAAETSWLGIALTAGTLVLCPWLGIAKQSSRTPGIDTVIDSRHPTLTQAPAVSPLPNGPALSGSVPQPRAQHRVPPAAEL